MKEKELIEVLALTYPYIGFVELRPVVLQIMNKCQQIPLPLLQSLHEQLPALQIQVPVRVMHQLWMFNEKDFIEAIQPLIKLYILQSTTSWSVRAAQHLQRTQIDDAEQYLLRASTMHLAASDAPVEALASFNLDHIVFPCDLDLRLTYLSLSSIVISNPSEDTLRMMKLENETLGSNRNAFSRLFDASNTNNANNTLIAEIISPTATKIEEQFKLGAPTNSYSQFSRRELNIPLQLLSDYIGEHLPLYQSAIKYVRRLMMEIQAYQHKPRLGIDLERQCPLLASLGILPLFTVHQVNRQGSEPPVISIDPALAQILGSLRFDLLMAQHDRTHTSICENDSLYRFAWCLDAIRREKTVEQRHYDEMEDIFTVLNTQLSSIKRAPTTASKANAEREAAEKQATNAKKAKATSATSKKSASTTSKEENVDEDAYETRRSTRSRALRGDAKSDDKTETGVSGSEPASTRRERSSSTRNTSKQTLGQAEADDVDLTDEEDKVTPARTRPKRLKRNKSTKNTQGKGDLKDGKPAKKKVKEADDWDDDSEEVYEDAGKVMDEGEEYVDFSDGEDSDISDADDDFDENDYSSESDEYAPSTRRKSAKRTKATSAKASGAKTTSSTSKGGLKVTLMGLTGTGALASQSSVSKDGIMSGGGAIKLKRGNQVLVDTAAALSSFSGSNDSRAVSSLYNTIIAEQLDGPLNLIAEYGWVIATGSMQMTLQTVLFNILKDLSQKHSKPPTPSVCDPLQDIDSVKKTIMSDKRVSRLMGLLQLAFSNIFVLTGDGSDSHILVALQAERVIDSKILNILLATNLSAANPKHGSKKKLEDAPLNAVDRSVNLLSTIVILSAYFERFDSRNVMKDTIKAENDDDNLTKEQNRLDSIMAMSQRHQHASGDVPPDVIGYIATALNGTDETEVTELSHEIVPGDFTHPDAAISMLLFWSLTQAGSANENVVSSIAHWTTENSDFWSTKGFWRLLHYPTFIQEVLFGFCKIPLSSPVASLKHIMVDKLLMKPDSQNSLLSSTFGALQLLSYLYVALCHGSIHHEEAAAMIETLRLPLEKSNSYIFGPIVSSLHNAIVTHLDHAIHAHQEHADPSYEGYNEYHGEHHEGPYPPPPPPHEEYH